VGATVHVWLAPAGADRRSEAHDLLRALAGTLVDDPVLRHDTAGRPRIPGLAVSITYSDGLIAVAASYDGPLGIDLEDIRPRAFAPLANRWFDPHELEWMAEQPDQLTAFLHLWTAKEAVGKALGLGLRKSGLRRRIPLGDSSLAVTHEFVGGAVLAIAAPAPAPGFAITLQPRDNLPGVTDS
jgi:phosphopantetheinyl transferase